MILFMYMCLPNFSPRGPIFSRVVHVCVQLVHSSVMTYPLCRDLSASEDL